MSDYDIGNPRKKDYEGYIVLCFHKIPEHCGECKIYKDNYYTDEDWGFDMHYCPFCKDSMFGCLVKRPQGCPIIKNNKTKSTP